MTKETTTAAPVTVEQCDREAGLQLRLYTTSIRPGDYRYDRICAYFRSGARDDKETVQAFARHRLAALASASAGDGVEATVLTVTVRDDGTTSFHSSIPRGQSWLDTLAAMEHGFREFQRQFEDSHKCPVKPAALARPRAAVGERDGECPSSPDGRHQVDTSMESGSNNCFHCEAPMGGAA